MSKGLSLVTDYQPECPVTGEHLVKAYQLEWLWTGVHLLVKAYQLEWPLTGVHLLVKTYQLEWPLTEVLLMEKVYHLKGKA